MNKWFSLKVLLIILLFYNNITIAATHELETDSLKKSVKTILKGNWESAIPYLKQAIEKEPDNEILHYLLSNAYYFQNNFRLQSHEKNLCLNNKTSINNILDWAKRLVESHPDNAIAHLLLADIYAGNLQFEKAIEENNKVLDLNPELINAKINVAIIYMAIKAYRKAESILKKTLEIEPNNAVIHSNLGTIQENKGDRNAAMKYYQKAIELNPELSDAYTRVGYIYCTKANWKAGMNNLEKAIEINPNDAQAHCLLGIAFLEGKNDKKQAVLFFNKALKLDPNGNIGKKAKYCLQKID